MMTEQQNQSESERTIRILHHLARSGGTLISRCVGAMEGIVLLSEAHPLGQKWINTVRQAKQWFGLLSDSEANRFQTESNGAAFVDLIELLADRCAERNQRLVLRDWSHLDFTGIPFIDQPSFQLTTAEQLSERFRVVNVGTVRQPLGQLMSLSKLKNTQGRLVVPDFLHGQLHL